MYSFGIPKGAEPAPAVDECVQIRANILPRWLTAALLGLLLWAGMTLASVARADDAQIFADLIPGEQLDEAELEQLHGRGIRVRGLSRLACCGGVSSGKRLMERLLGGGRGMKPATRSAGKSPRLGGTSFSRAGAGIRTPEAPRRDVRDSAGDRGVGGLAHSIGLARSLSGKDYGP